MIEVEILPPVYENAVESLSNEWQRLADTKWKWLGDDEKEDIIALEKDLGCPAGSDGICFTVFKNNEKFYLQGTEVDLFLANGFDIE